MSRTAATLPAQPAAAENAAADTSAPHTNGNGARTTTPTPVDTALSNTAIVIDPLVANATAALAAYADFTQEQIDFIVKKAAVAALAQHGELAQAAVAETGRGVFEDKAVKNIFVSEQITHSLQYLKTVGVISDDEISGIVEIAEPVGVVCGITPVTNPTSTAIFKSLIALKTRNPIIFAFHPGAQQCSSAAARVVRDAAIAAGAPAHCIQWVEHPSIALTDALMNHPGIALILATGGNAMVKAAYSCGKPALGVGAGNVPAFIERTAKLRRAVNDVVASKSFDNGMVCASEQAVILDEPIYEAAMAEFVKLHAYRCNSSEKAALERLMFGVDSSDGAGCSGAKLNAAIVGQSPVWIAEHAGFSVPRETSIILAEVSSVGRHEPLTREKLCPVLAVLRAESTEAGITLAEQMVELDGLGHSAAIHTENEALAIEFGRRVKAVRILRDSPSTMGGIGDVYNALVPSMTLGCGSYGHNSVSGNVSAINLINIKRVARRNNNLQWFKVPSKTYFEPNAIRYLVSMLDVTRVTIVTDSTMTRLGFVDKILDVLGRRQQQVALQIIDSVEPEPSTTTVYRGAELMRAFKPDTIIALGGGSPMDAAKVMWLLYEHPEVNFSDLREKFFDIRKRAFRYPKLGALAQLVCIPTTSGTGAEVTPFAVITDPATGMKYPLADYALTPTIAIIDPVLTAKMPASLAADSGFDALTHATEAFVSVYANDFTDGMALQAIRLIFDNIATSVNGQPGAPETTAAREKMHNAGTIAGMAFGNAFLGIVHAMAHTIGAKFHLVHGRTNATLLPAVIRYNGTIPTKLTSWPKYEYYVAPERFQLIAKALGLPSGTPEEGVESYAVAVESLRAKVGIPASFQAQGVDEHDFIARLDELAMGSYRDQCAPANPRMPMLQDMKELMVAAFYGISIDEARMRTTDKILAESVA